MNGHLFMRLMATVRSLAESTYVLFGTGDMLCEIEGANSPHLSRKAVQFERWAARLDGLYAVNNRSGLVLGRTAEDTPPYLPEVSWDPQYTYRWVYCGELPIQAFRSLVERAEAHGVRPFQPDQWAHVWILDRVVQDWEAGRPVCLRSADADLRIGALYQEAVRGGGGIMVAPAAFGIEGQEPRLLAELLPELNLEDSGIRRALRRTLNPFSASPEDVEIG